MAAIIRQWGRTLNPIVAVKLLSNNGTSEALPIRCISGRTLRGESRETSRPAPWPYKVKRYNKLHSLFDRTTKRFDENSKVLVVEGPIAAGKTKLAKELAEELDMLYFPEANQDMIYINEAGYDLKQLDNQLPADARSFDIKDYLKNPRHKLSSCFQMVQYGVRFSQYVDALAHLLSTGQGVVLDRCVYSDYVFAEAMYSAGYITKQVREAYYEVRKNTLGELLRPHLVIYLDLPVDKVLEKIKQRNYSVEANSQVLTSKYLSVMENSYKQQYLKEIGKHAELLIYDWSEEGEVEVVVEDIERINFTSYDKQDLKMKDWDHEYEEDWAILRHTFTDDKQWLMQHFNVPRYDVPEFQLGAEDYSDYIDIWENAPGNLYEPGYDSSLGDTGILFKTSLRPRRTLPLIERRFP